MFPEGERSEMAAEELGKIVARHEMKEQGTKGTQGTEGTSETIWSLKSLPSFSSLSPKGGANG